MTLGASYIRFQVILDLCQLWRCFLARKGSSVLDGMGKHWCVIPLSSYSSNHQSFVKQWDLNTGQRVRSFTHGAQLTAVGMRPLSGPLVPESTDQVSITIGPEPNTSTTNAVHGVSDRTEAMPEPANTGADEKPAASNAERPAEVTQPEAETKSEASYDPLFDDEPDADIGQSGIQPKVEPNNTPVLPNSTQHDHVPAVSQKRPPIQAGLVPPPKKPTIPLLDPVSYGEYSTDILLAASIDGQVVLWDRRARTHGGVGRLEMSDKCPPWCLSVRALPAAAKAEH